MENKQINLLFKVLRILDGKGVLKHLVVVGSWCMFFYTLYFQKKQPIASLRTRDVDFLVPDPRSLKTNIDLPELLKSLGFLIDYRGEQGYIRLVHPEFFIEFLVSEKGKGTDKAFSLPQLGLNAQALRFMDILYLKTVTLQTRGIKIKLPHPACFVLHKIIVFKRRPEKERREKEVEQIDRMLDLLGKEGKISSLKRFFLKLHPKWRKKVISNLKTLDKNDVVSLLQ